MLGEDRVMIVIYRFCRLNLVESQLWNEDNWRGKYIGIVPRRGKEEKVLSKQILFDCFAVTS